MRIFLNGVSNVLFFRILKKDLKDLDRFERFDIRRPLVLAEGDYFCDSLCCYEMRGAVLKKHKYEPIKALEIAVFKQIM